MRSSVVGDIIESDLVSNSYGGLKKDQKYSLRMKVGWFALGVKEIAVPSRVIDSVQLSLPHEKICFPQRPGLCHGEFIEVVSNRFQLIVRLLKSFFDFSFSEEVSLGLFP